MNGGALKLYEVVYSFTTVAQPCAHTACWHKYVGSHMTSLWHSQPCSNSAASKACCRSLPIAVVKCLHFLLLTGT